MMEKDPVLIEIDAPLMRITIQRQHCLNALDRKSHFILTEAFDLFSKDASLRVATITGPMAKPSRPSVKLTALLVPATTKHAKGM